MALTQWILAHHPGEDALGQRTHSDALALLDHIVLALKGASQETHLAEADTLTALLRVRVRLACKLGLLDDRQLVFLTGELDAIGRQIGGWLKRLER